MNGKESSLYRAFSNVYNFSIFVCMKTKAKSKRTNIVVNEDLIKDIRRFSELKTKREIIERALEDQLNYLKRQKLRSLRGKITWEGDLMKMREGRL
jgi:Arc/MetJ family transcription regulator